MEIVELQHRTAPSGGRALREIGPDFKDLLRGTNAYLQVIRTVMASPGIPKGRLHACVSLRLPRRCSRPCARRRRHRCPSTCSTDARRCAHDLWRHRAGDVRGIRSARRERIADRGRTPSSPTPTPATLAAARTAWKAARVPYLQTEGLRFGNAIVDEWEPKVNSWPLDEGLIDYVAMRPTARPRTRTRSTR